MYSHSKLLQTNKAELIKIATDEFSYAVNEDSTKEALISLIEAGQEEQRKYGYNPDKESEDYTPDTDNAATEGDERVTVEVKEGKKIWHEDGVASGGETVELNSASAERFEKLGLVKYVKNR